MSYLNLISFLGIFGLCGVAWIFSEDRRVIPWRVIIWGVGLQLVLGFLVFQFDPTQAALEWFSDLLNVVFDAADAGARFVFGRNIVPLPGQDPLVFTPAGANNLCPPNTPAISGLCGVKLGYIFAFRALPTVIFFSGFMALLENLGIIQIIVNFFGWIFYRTMRLSGAESLSGAANIFVGIEAAIVVKPYLAQMTRSELCAILACCFGTAASSTLAIYVGFLRPVFPNILGHLISASIIAIPACFVLSKILVPETGIPVTMGGIPKENKQRKEPDILGESLDKDGEQLTEDGEPQLEAVGTEVMQRVSPLDAAILGALDGVKMCVAIAAVLILIVGLVYLVNQLFGFLGTISPFLKVLSLANIMGVLFYPLTLLTGVAVDVGKLTQGIPDESWQASVIIGRRLFETAIPPYQALGEAAKAGTITPRTLLIVSYALSGFAHLASVGIFVGGTIALIPSRRKDISELGWKALFVGTLATMMIAAVAGVFDDGSPSILGNKENAPHPTPTATTTPTNLPTAQPTVAPSLKPTSKSSEKIDKPEKEPKPTNTASKSPTPTPK